MCSRRYKQHLPKYTHKELVFPGVQIESVTVDKLVTFFDRFDSLISNAASVRSHKEAQLTVVKARQYRLNHKPFTYYIRINSDKNVKAIIRVFLGPKYNVYGQEVDITESHVHFLELDQWVVQRKYQIVSSFYERSNIFVFRHSFEFFSSRKDI